MAVIKHKRGANLQLSESFHLREFDCKGSSACCSCNCTQTIIDTRLLYKLQILRRRANGAISISSAYRCERHNDCVGGARNSYHKMGMAADIYSPKLAPAALAKLAQQLGFSGIGRYGGAAGSFVHVDVRDVNYFWTANGKGSFAASGFGGVHESCPYELGSRVLALSSEGEDVRALQWLIEFCGIACEVDGMFGRKTETTLRELQRMFYLTSDGICGPKTRAVLMEAAG